MAAMARPVVLGVSIDAFLADRLRHSVVDHVTFVFIGPSFEVEENEFLPGLLGKRGAYIT